MTKAKSLLFGFFVAVAFACGVMIACKGPVYPKKIVWAGDGPVPAWDAGPDADELSPCYMFCGKLRQLDCEDGYDPDCYPACTANEGFVHFDCVAKAQSSADLPACHVRCYQPPVE